MTPRPPGTIKLSSVALGIAVARATVGAVLLTAGVWVAANLAGTSLGAGALGGAFFLAFACSAVVDAIRGVTIGTAVSVPVEELAPTNWLPSARHLGQVTRISVVRVEDGPWAIECEDGDTLTVAPGTTLVLIRPYLLIGSADAPVAKAICRRGRLHLRPVGGGVQPPQNATPATAGDDQLSAQD